MPDNVFTLLMTIYSKLTNEQKEELLKDYFNAAKISTEAQVFAYFQEAKSILNSVPICAKIFSTSLTKSLKER
jgi:hypothetical protein